MIKKCIQACMIVAALAFGAVALATPTVSAVNTGNEVCKGVKAAGGDCSDTSALPDFIKNIINILLFIAGAVAVIMIILGAIRYITSNGDQAHVKAAKETILYSVIGLVVAVLAYAIVNFVLKSL